MAVMQHVEIAGIRLEIRPGGGPVLARKTGEAVACAGNGTHYLHFAGFFSRHFFSRFSEMKNPYSILGA